MVTKIKEFFVGRNPKRAALSLTICNNLNAAGDSADLIVLSESVGHPDIYPPSEDWLLQHERALRESSLILSLPKKRKEKKRKEKKRKEKKRKEKKRKERKEKKGKE
ncbi:nucleolar protein 58-like, partial [Chiroxiphia lanceolata]|uniref:nucleolar protein 58-like n=1 Tax=Chiroxiphia lanceolata TaxID=296741 RepID=UPI0013CF25B5